MKANVLIRKINKCVHALMGWLKPIIITKLLFFDNLSLFQPEVLSTVVYSKLNERTLNNIINNFYTVQRGGEGLD